MEQTLLIILIDALLVAVIALFALLFLDWRKKTRCHAALEQLFEDVNERQTLRNERIMGCLTRQYKLDKQAAQELSTALFGAEKLFITQFIEQQMRQQSVEGFYENLCDLLDSYMEAIPARAVDTSQSGDSTVAPTLENVDPDGKVRADEASDKTPPPDRGDVLD